MFEKSAFGWSLINAFGKTRDSENMNTVLLSDI